MVHNSPLSTLPRTTGVWSLVLTGLTGLMMLLFVVYRPATDRSGPSKSSKSIVAPMQENSTADVRSSLLPYPIVFVSRAIPDQGSIYWDEAMGMPGAGPHSRFRNCAPGKLQILYPSGNLVTLIDGSNPTPASMNLIDVNAPDVSYDGTKIVFAGLPNGNHSTDPAVDLDAWRLFVINVDGSGLQQLTFSDLNLDYSQFNDPIYNSNPFGGYDDTDPCWLPDGRIVFSSTRYPSYAQYSGVRTSNLFVINADGSGMKRITTERNAADRPVVDPLTGQIVYARWWRNQRFPYDPMITVPTPLGYRFKDGLSSDRNVQVGGPDFMWRNSWHLASINPDGGELKMFSGSYRSDPGNFAYGGSFTPEGDFVANFFPMNNMTEASGFGGLRKFFRGPSSHQDLAGMTDPYSYPYVHPENPTSFGIHVSDDGYAAEPEVLPDGRIVFSWCTDYLQDYGLYIMNADGSNRTIVYDEPGRAELRAKAIRPRPLPPVIPDEYTHQPNPLPPLETPPYDLDGTFVFDAKNIYFNAPVDVEIESAPAVGSAASLRFYLDHQRRSHGSHEEQDWPVVVGEVPVQPDGSAINPNAPAEVPLFEQLRSSTASGYKVPFVEMPFKGAAGHVAGMNYGRKNSVVSCVGCHAGHSMIEVPTDTQEILFSNLAPGAELAVSTTRDPNTNYYLIDRRVMKAEGWQVWTSKSGKTKNQWALLKFPVPVTIRAVKPYNIPTGGEPNSSIKVTRLTVTLYSDKEGTIPIISKTYSATLPSTGATISFNDVVAQSVRIKINRVSGTFYGAAVAGLAEVEVIASGRIFSNKSQPVIPASMRALVYPNPAHDQMTVYLYSRMAGPATIKVYSLSGHLFQEETLEVGEGWNHTPLQISQLPSGLYILRIEQGRQQHIVKFLKQ